MSDRLVEHQRLRRDYEHLAAEHALSHKREEELIDSLISAQLRVDRLESIRNANEKRIEELNKRLELIGQEERGQASTEKRAKTNSKSSQARIRELERELDCMTSRLGSLDLKANARSTAWRLLGAQRERLAAENALAENRKESEKLSIEIQELGAVKRTALRELALIKGELNASKRAHQEHIARLEQRIRKLSCEAEQLRHMGAQEAIEQICQFDNEDAIGKQEAMEEIRNELDRLRSLCSVLQETCATIRDQLEQTKETENELQQTRRQVVELNREVAELRASVSRRSTVDKDDKMLGSELQMKVENRRLRRTIEQLRRQLHHGDPHMYKSNYHFVSGI